MTIDFLSWVILAAVAQPFIGRFLIWWDCEVAPSKFDNVNRKKGS